MDDVMPGNPELIPFDKAALDSIEAAVTVFVSDHQTIVISNDEELKSARGLWEECKAHIKQVDLDSDPIRKPLREALDALYERIRMAKEPLEMLKKKLESTMKGYQQEQETKRLKAAQDLQDKRLAEAAALEREGKTEEAETVITRAAETVPAPAAGPKLDQRTFGKKWFARVVDASKFYGALAEVANFRGYASIEIAKLNQLARTVKGKDLGIPGVEGYEE